MTDKQRSICWFIEHCDGATKIVACVNNGVGSIWTGWARGHVSAFIARDHRPKLTGMCASHTDWIVIGPALSGCLRPPTHTHTQTVGWTSWTVLVRLVPPPLPWGTRPDCTDHSVIALCLDSSYWPLGHCPVYGVWTHPTDHSSDIALCLDSPYWPLGHCPVSRLTLLTTRSLPCVWSLDSPYWPLLGHCPVSGLTLLTTRSLPCVWSRLTDHSSVIALWLESGLILLTTPRSLPCVWSLDSPYWPLLGHCPVSGLTLLTTPNHPTDHSEQWWYEWTRW